MIRRAIYAQHVLNERLSEFYSLSVEFSSKARTSAVRSFSRNLFSRNNHFKGEALTIQVALIRLPLNCWSFQSFNQPSKFPLKFNFCQIIYSAVSLNGRVGMRGEYYGSKKLIKISLKYANVNLVICRGIRIILFYFCRHGTRSVKSFYAF